jgi:hypothetical protein
MRDRGDAAKHAGRRELATEHSIKTWHEMVARYAQLITLGVKDEILNDARSNAVDAFEAMLDSVKSEAEAKRLLQATRQSDPRQRGQNTRKKPPNREEPDA